MPWPRAPVVLAALAVLLVGCSPPRGIEAARVLADLSQPDAGGRETLAPTSIAFPPGSGVTVADLYWPPGAEAALVLVPGVVPEGKDDPRLVELAQTLVRARFAVLVPDIENLRAQQVSPADARAIAAAVVWLAGCGVPADVPSVGVMAISYAAGPAILAALRPDAAPHVRFLVAIGGYYDLKALVTFFTTGYFRTGPDEPWQRGEPNAYGKWVFVAANAERLDDPGDRAALAAMAERKLADLDADVADLEAGLGPQGRAVMALLDNRDPDRVPALIDNLPEAVRNDLGGLDLARQDLSQLEARLLLVHGRDDPIIPATESEALAAAAPDATDLYVVDSLAHVEVDLAGLTDGFWLWRAVYQLLGERDAAPEPVRDACPARAARSGLRALKDGLLSSAAGFSGRNGRSMEIAMADTVAAHTRDFARHFFGTVLERGRENWVAASDAFERTAAAHADHPYLAYLQVNRARRAGFAAVAERVREREFPQIERRKAGTRRNAPVFYRVGRADASFELELPYEVPSSHPLRSAAATAHVNPLRREPEPAAARSPWRRRLRRRPTDDSTTSAESRPGDRWWQKLAGRAAGLLDAITGRAAKRKR